MERVKLSRRDLYDLVWAESLPALSKKFEIPYSDLRNLCVKMNIPLPKVGHWMKLLAGKKVFIPDLPEDYSGIEEITLPLEEAEQQVVELVQTPIIALQKEIERDNELLLKVPASLSKPCDLILAAKKTLKSQKPSKYDRYKEMVGCNRGELDIRVSQKNIDRAICFMDTLIKLLYARGHDVIFENDDTRVVMEEVKVSIKLREKTKRVQGTDRWQTYEYHPTGILYFHVDTYPDGNWEDGKLLLEAKLSKIAAKLEIDGRQRNEWRRLDKIHEIERNEKERVQREFKKCRANDLRNFEKLLMKSNRWHKSQVLRNYLDELEIKSVPNSSNSEEQKKWFEWARKKTDWYDPFVEAQDELLRHIDRDTLSYHVEEEE
ncbi:MAG: hypothetical protein NT084_14480 [Bacteroidetes bacterium]|nr:hypothetical protein [Bacteroidota bacterium]